METEEEPEEEPEDEEEQEEEKEEDYQNKRYVCSCIGEDMSLTYY